MTAISTVTVYIILYKENIFSAPLDDDDNKPYDCEYSGSCATKDKICTRFTKLDGTWTSLYCVKINCKKDKDCSKLDKGKHKPAKCKNKKCKYEFD